MNILIRAIIVSVLIAPAARHAIASDAGKSLAPVKPVLACADLAKQDLTAIGGAGSKVSKAVETTSGTVPVCQVNAVLAPSIQFTLQLPIQSWAQRYLQLGCGGLCGMINMQAGVADGCKPLNTGAFAMAATDMGHQGNDPSFGRDAQKRADFAYRAEHLTALASKKLVKAFYGKQAMFAYFNGCSDGGREALMEAQRYPDDFNGIIAGAPAAIFQVQNSFHHGWLALSNTGADGKPILYASRLPLLHAAVLKACDALDGNSDGLLSDPRVCAFDPASIQCAAGSTGTAACLTAAEVGVAQKIYDGPRDVATGTALVVGPLQRGSELAWQGVSVPADGDTNIFSGMIALQALQNLIFEQNPPDSYKLSDLKFDLATFNLLRARHPLLDATNPDLSAFVAKGGKLIQWHGWSDPHISPITSIAYHDAVVARMGKKVSQSFTRLYMLPGVFHCGQGEGPSQIDFLSAAMNWVEKGVAPDSVISAQSNAAPTAFGQPPAASATGKAPPAGAKPPQVKGPDRSRPLYPYPEIAKYKGSGDVMAAENYERAPALYAEPVPAWAGTGFFTPYKPRSQ